MEADMYKVETGYAVPVLRSSGGKYPFKTMQVGESFFVEGEENAKRMHSTVYNYGVRYGKKFVARKVEGGVRVWRMA
jgi:hypothetical protein